jgi:hypothetical protein
MSEDKSQLCEGDAYHLLNQEVAHGRICRGIMGFHGRAQEIVALADHRGITISHISLG